MFFSIFGRGAAHSLIVSFIVLSSYIFFLPELSAGDTAFEKSAKAELRSETATVDPLQACYDSMNKLVPKLKFKDMAGYENYSEIHRQIKRIEIALKNGCVLYSADGTSDKVSQEKLDEMLTAENERLEEAKKAISHTQKELDEMTAAAVYVESGSREKPAVCPEKGIYSVAQDDKLNYKIKCSVHGAFDDVRARLYEKAMKSTEPGKFCRGNVSAIIGACKRYSIDYGVPAEWSLETLIEEGYLEGECICPAGGTYTIKGGKWKDFTCSCSVHK